MNVIPDPQAGERMLEAAVACARDLWDERLLSAYALGSLAHGGFSVHVSDVDVAFILRDPLQQDDHERVERLLALVKGRNMPLSERLSVFWGSREILSGQVRGGRFPAADRQDLLDFGRILAGRDMRSEFVRPGLKQLVAEGAELALLRLSSPAVIATLKAPAALAAGGTTKLTKWLLFPVRLIYTARTGNVARAEVAVQHFCVATGGPSCALARRAFEWRYAPPSAPFNEDLLELIEQGVPLLYGQFLDEYELHLRKFERADLADAFSEWHRKLRAPASRKQRRAVCARTST